MTPIPLNRPALADTDTPFSPLYYRTVGNAGAILKPGGGMGRFLLNRGAAALERIGFADMQRNLL